VSEGKERGRKGGRGREKEGGGCTGERLLGWRDEMDEGERERMGGEGRRGGEQEGEGGKRKEGERLKEGGGETTSMER